MIENFRNERDYQKALLTFLRKDLAGNRIWALEGQPVYFLGRAYYPDIEIEAFRANRLRTIAVVELKLNNRIDLSQPRFYASFRNAQYYGAIDGFRRTPLKWYANNNFCAPEVFSVDSIAEDLKVVKYSIERFNFINFL